MLKHFAQKIQIHNDRSYVCACSWQAADGSRIYSELTNAYTVEEGDLLQCDWQG